MSEPEQVLSRTINSNIDFPELPLEPELAILLENDFEGIEDLVYTEDAVSTNIIQTNTSKKRTHSFSEDDSIDDDLFKDKSYCPNSETESVLNSEPLNDNVQLFTQDKTDKSNKKKWSRAVRKERTLNLHRGLPYVNSSGNEVTGRQMQPLKSCRKKCIEILTDDIRISIFNEYWSLGDHGKRVNFISSLINSADKKTSRVRCINSNKTRDLTLNYFFEINGKRHSVCKDCFCKTLDEKEGFIRSVIKNKLESVSGISAPDKRGKQSSANKTTENTLAEVIAHINFFPAHESHYTRKKNDKKYLQSHLNLNIMYQMYKDNHNHNNTVSRFIYEREFHKLKLSFKKPKVDTCHKCDTLQMQIKTAEESKNEDMLITSKNTLNVHQFNADLGYSSKAIDKEISKNNPEKECFSFDLQQCLPTPYLQSSVAFYKRQLWTFNLTIHNNADGQSFNYMWHEAVAGRGANEIASCLFKHLINNTPNNVTELTFYSDTCGGQNKNSHVSAMFLKIIQMLPSVNIINHKFLVPGHTHMECDVDHSLIEKQKKKIQVPIFHPHDWYQLVRSTGKKNKFKVIEMAQDDFFDFAKLLKGPLVAHKINTDREPFKWHDVQWLQYRKSDKGIINYKNTLEEDASFKSLSFRRRGKYGDLNVEKRYSGPVLISKEKKKDLLDLLPLIPPTFHSFYSGLKATNDIFDNDPDLEEVNFDD